MARTSERWSIELEKEYFKFSAAHFDAMAQIESTQSPDFVLAAMRGANVERMALFARLHRRRGGERNVLQAGKLIQQIAPIVGGKGGGKPDSARGGGKEIARLDEALEKARALLGA